MTNALTLMLFLIGVHLCRVVKTTVFCVIFVSVVRADSDNGDNTRTLVVTILMVRMVLTSHGVERVPSRCGGEK